MHPLSPFGNFCSFIYNPSASGNNLCKGILNFFSPLFSLLPPFLLLSLLFSAVLSLSSPLLSSLIPPPSSLLSSHSLLPSPSSLLVNMKNLPTTTNQHLATDYVTNYANLFSIRKTKISKGV